MDWSAFYQAFLAFFILFTFLTTLAVRCGRDDPSSLFFQHPGLGYTAYRDIEALSYLEADHAPPTKSTGNVKVCVAINSVSRGMHGSYLRKSVGSLLAGLTEAERKAIYVQVLIAHTAPQEHPAYLEPWLANAADRILTYDKRFVDVERVS